MAKDEAAISDWQVSVFAKRQIEFKLLPQVMLPLLFTCFCSARILIADNQAFVVVACWQSEALTLPLVELEPRRDNSGDFLAPW